MHDVSDLLEVLDLRPVGDSVFEGRNSALDLPRVFGGQLAAQALVAAARTVPSRQLPQSLHATFLRPGRPEAVNRFAVEHVRDGRSRTTRTVTATQDGREVLRLTAAFGPPSTGVGHQTPPPHAGKPQDAPTLDESIADLGGLMGLWTGFAAVDIRVAPCPDGAASRGLLWMRATAPLPDDPVTHAAVLCYATDLTLLSAALVPHGLRLGRERDHSHAWDTVSLDHALWFHHIPRADEWLLFDQHSPVASHGRALATAQVYDTTGELVATVTQEGLLIAEPLT
ncbi:acyl-CoA thioesterase domain-containing protein [Dactylosporangium sp. NPDC049140]|uniref:acyl-CoA thioesterase n=1 Tax=Dactylosporangium sp. NPDC049140 TaxID=3155647 RepID=UPI0033C27159